MVVMMVALVIVGVIMNVVMKKTIMAMTLKKMRAARLHFSLTRRNLEARRTTKILPGMRAPSSYRMQTPEQCMQKF